VASRLLAAAVATEKPVVIYFLGQAIPIRRLGALHFAISLEEAADLAVNLLEEPPIASSDPALSRSSDDGRRWLRGLFSGGTLALEAALGLRLFLEPLFSNLKLDGVRTLKDPAHSQGHAILDLGSDEYTFGRLHPMIDPDLRLRRLRQEAADPRVALVLLDLVLGEGSHADPAQQLAPAIEEVLHVVSSNALARLRLKPIETDNGEAVCRQQSAGKNQSGASTPARTQFIDRSPAKIRSSACSQNRRGQDCDDGADSADFAGIAQHLCTVKIGYLSIVGGNGGVANALYARVQRDHRPAGGEIGEGGAMGRAVCVTKRQHPTKAIIRASISRATMCGNLSGLSR